MPHEDVSYTTDEIAKLLKISKLTVYDLIKKGEIPSYRVGKQMRVDASDLEAYKRRAKGAPLAAASAQASLQAAARTASGERQLVITGQDVSLDLLAQHLEKKSQGIRPLRSYVGSLDGLIALYRGESDIVSTHLLDGDTGEYNLPYVRKILVGLPIVVVRLLSRSAGLYVGQGNPLGLEGWDDLRKPGLRLANRERGSGARVLLDEQLRLRGIPASSFLGYELEDASHMAVAGKVASGLADVGVGIEKAARFVGGIDYIPLVQERYDLVMRKSQDNLEWIETVLAVVSSEAFRSELRSVQGYDLSETGNILFES